MDERFDDAVVGAGILGLAHAYHLARRGRRVVVFERQPRAQGASIRNFGMIWPIGQPAGPLRQLALRSQEVWLDVLRRAGLWHETTGSLHLAYHDDEAQVLAEFADREREDGSSVALLTPSQVRDRSAAVKMDGLRAGLWSPTELGVDPREVIAALPAWLAREYGVRFLFGQAVLGYDLPFVQTSGEEWVADRLFVCSGDDLQTLYPATFRDAGLIRCKLQMMRSQPVEGGWRLGPLLAGGLSLRHYRAFEGCPSLSALRDRVARASPDFDRFGIHVLASQNGRGEVAIGDSHEYDDAIEPFDNATIDELILGYLRTFLDVPGLRIASRWHGIYVKHPTEPAFVAHPAPGATIATGVGGAGLTLAFGLAEMVVQQALGEDKEA